MQRFYVTFPLHQTLEITDVGMYHQLTRVLRVKIGEKIVLFNGDGTEIEYEIAGITKKSIELTFQSRKSPSTEPSKKITLFQALPNKLEKLEYILQKGVEIGIHRFVLFRSDFSQKIVLTEGKKERLQTIAREALEQCGGVVMPEIEVHDKMVHLDKEVQNIVLDTSGDTINLQEVPQGDRIGLWVGPEGGWSEIERHKMKDNGFIFVRFGQRIMRTETAGVVTAFSILHL